MLRWIGHTRAAVLDGGWQAWTAAGLPGSTEAPTLQPAAYSEHMRAELAVDSASVASGVRQGSITVVDARSPDRFRGENETLDPVGGHVPGALNHFFKLNLGGDGHFKPPGELKDAFTALIGERAPTGVVHQCGSGVTACHNLLAMEHAGLSGSRLYPGSWSEWVSDRSRPVER